MAIKLFGSSITSAYKLVVSTVSKTVSKVSGGSSSKSSSTNSKSSSSGNKTSGSSKSSSSGKKASGSTSNKTSSSGKKTSVTATSKTVSSNASKVSSTSKQSTSTKYVTNAAAIYNASGKKVSAQSSVSTGRPAQSYATQTKTSTTNSQKSTGSAATVKTTTAKAKTVSSTSVKSTSSKAPSSVSTGRPAQSYATQKKVSATSNQKIVKTASGNKTEIGSQSRTANSAISTGRPEQSYISQQKTSTVKGQVTQIKLTVPVAQKAPLVTKTSTSKKDASEASYSNNRPKKSYTHVVAYTPTASREGAGQMFYRNKTEPKGAKAGASFATSCIPYLGDAKDIQEAVTGKDLITGKKLTGGDRALTITAAALPVVSGPMLKGAVKGGKVAVKEVPGAVKKAGKLIKKNVPKVKKAVKNTDEAEDIAKVLREKVVKKVKDNKTKEIIKTEKITEQVKENSGLKQRPSWRQSEIDTAKDYPDFTGQKSFINGEQCTYGKKGSVRPDYYKEGVSIEIKNYKIDTASGRSNLARNIEKQYLKRVAGLPEGTKQTVIIDIRGQSIDEEKMDLLYENIMHRTNRKVDILFKK